MEPINAANSGIINPPPEKKKKAGKTLKTGRLSFLNAFKTADARQSEVLESSVDESLEELLDEVCGAGDKLKKLPSFANVKEYRSAVQKFIRFVVDNSYAVEKTRLSRFQVLKRRGQPELTLIKVVDKKLETLAAGILRNQFEQLEVLAKVDEINGLLVNLIQ